MTSLKKTIPPDGLRVDCRLAGLKEGGSAAVMGAQGRDARAENCDGDSAKDGGQVAGRCLSRQMGHDLLRSCKMGTRTRESGEMPLFWSEKWEGRRELPWSEVCGCTRCRRSQGWSRTPVFTC